MWLICFNFLLNFTKQDRCQLAHNTLEEMRVLAVQKINEGEHPGEVAASLGCFGLGPTSAEPL